MTTLTVITLGVMMFGVFGPRGYGVALALGGATAAGAAFVAGTVAVPTFYTTAIGAAVALGFQLLRRRGPSVNPRRLLPPGVPLLLLFFAWSTLVTFVAPVLFDGMAVLAPGGKGGELRAGVLTASNIAQVGYLALGVCVVVFLARSSLAGPDLIGLAAGLTTVLCLWRYFNEIAGVPFPDGVFDNSPAFAYIGTEVGGAPRFRGILSEPAGLAVSSLVTLGYMVPRSLQLTGWRRIGALAVAGAAAYLGSISTSATFFVAGGVVVTIVVVSFSLRFLSRRASVRAVFTVIACAAAIVSLWVLPIVVTFVEASLNQKVGSASFDERSNANAASYDIFVDTFGFGTGLGASRASSFFPGLLSTAGLVGTLLFVAAVVCVIRRSSSVRQYRPVAGALITLLIVKIVSGPDLSDTSGVLWISLGLLSRAALVAGAGGADMQPAGLTVPGPAAVGRRRTA